MKLRWELFREEMFVFLTALSFGLGACTTSYISPQEAHQRLAASIEAHQDHPFITEPVYKDLRKKMFNLTLLPDYIENPTEDTKVFTPQDKAKIAMLGGLNTDEIEAWAKLADTGYDGVVKTLYPVTDNQTSCKIINDGESFLDYPKKEPLRFQWEFVEGGCINGLAQGNAVAKSADKKADFTGRFNKGYMEDGVFKFRNGGTDYLQIGGVASNAHNGHALMLYSSAYTEYAYSNYNNQTGRDGLSVNLSYDRYDKHLTITDLGNFTNDKMNGMGFNSLGYEDKRRLYWPFSYGRFKDGKLTGPGAYARTNGRIIKVGNYADGAFNGKVYEESLFNGKEQSYNPEYYADVKTEIYGECDGAFRTFNGTSYSSGTCHIRNPNAGSINPGKAIAFVAGAAAIGSSPIDAASKVKITSAFAGDIYGGGNGTYLNQMYQEQLASAVQENEAKYNELHHEAQPAATPLKSYKLHVRCSDTGVENDINVPYRTESCRKAAVEFAKVFTCNETNQEEVMQNCQSACGDPQCLQR